jgi:hypothetical protein
MDKKTRRKNFGARITAPGFPNSYKFGRGIIHGG